MNNFQHSETGFVLVNGLNMYYEIHGEGWPLVLIHGGGSTIQTSFGNIIPLLAERRRVIAVELQAHGRTADRATPLSFEQDADDVAALLHELGILKADFLGFSNGAQTLVEIALRHPQLLNKIVLASTFFKRSAIAPPFWEGFESATLANMPAALKDGFLAVNDNPELLLNSFNRDVQRMKHFKGWSDEQISSIQTITLLMNADTDIASPEHAVEMYRLIPHCRLVILPGGHGSYLGTAESLPDGRWTQSYTAAIIEQFLDEG